MNIDELSVSSLELAQAGENIASFVGTDEARIQLLNRTLAKSTSLTHQMAQTMFDLNTKVLELESKLEYARLYGFSRNADDE